MTTTVKGGFRVWLSGRPRSCESAHWQQADDIAGLKAAVKSFVARNRLVGDEFNGGAAERRGAVDTADNIWLGIGDIDEAGRFAQDDLEEPNPLFGYYVNLNERGYFEADVRDTAGKTVFEIKAGASLGPDETSIFEDGFMRNNEDLGGLATYLKQLKVIPAKAEVLDMHEFEERLDRQQFESDVQESAENAYEEGDSLPATRGPGM